MAHSLDYAIKKAKKTFEKGQIEEAKLAFQSILRVFPENRRAKHALDLIEKKSLTENESKASLQQLYSNADYKSAIKEAERLIRLEPTNHKLWNLMGASYGKIEQFDDALISFQKAHEYAPKDPSPLCNLGSVYRAKNELDKAEKFFLETLEYDPNYFDAHKNLAVIYQDEEKFDKSEFHYLSAIKSNPNNADILNAFANLLAKNGQQDKAIASYHKSLELEPENFRVLNNLGNLYLSMKKHEKAIETYEKALEIEPNYSDALNNIANALKEIDYLDEAIFYYRQALKAPNAKLELKSNIGVALKDRGYFDEAKKYLNEAIAERDNYADAIWNKSLADIASGNLKEGWEGFEWRWKATNFDSKHLVSAKPRWTGNKERVLIWPEQGVGDQLMFSTMFEEFSQYCDRAIFQVDRRLLPIFRRTFKDVFFIPSDKKLSEDEYDSHIPMGSITKYIRNDFQSFENGWARKLSVESEKSKRIRQAFRLGSKKLIGISWFSKNIDYGTRRSIPLEQFVSPFKGSDFALVSLQYGDTGDEIKNVYQKTGVPIFSVNEIDNFTDIDGLASLINCCDGVVTIDNSTVHLAAAIGKPTHLLLPSQLDWRWFNNEHGNTWYDCLTIHSTPHGYKITDKAEEFIVAALRQIEANF